MTHVFEDVAMVELYDMITLVTQSCVSLLEPKLQAAVADPNPNPKPKPNPNPNTKPNQVATTQPWTHLVLELRGLPPHCPGIGHVQASRYAKPRWLGLRPAGSPEAASRCCPDASVGLQLVATSASLGQPRPASASLGQSAARPRWPAISGVSSTPIGPLPRGGATAVAARHALAALAGASTTSGLQPLAHTVAASLT